MVREIGRGDRDRRRKGGEWMGKRMWVGRRQEQGLVRGEGG